MNYFIDIKSREEITKNIEFECKEIYKNKLKIFQIINEKLKNENLEYEIVGGGFEFLRYLNIDFPILFKSLWENPVIMVKILEKINTEELKDNFANFIVNNFYENLFSANSLEEQLLYIFTILLKEEINKISNLNEFEVFLNETNCSYLLEELRKKHEYQEYFKVVIQNAIKKLEETSSKIKFNLNINFLDNELENLKKFNNSKIKNKNEIPINLDEIKNILTLSESEIIGQKYIKNLDTEALKQLTEENNKNKNIFHYYNSKLNEYISDSNIYSNSLFLQKIENSTNKYDLFIIYKSFFAKIVSFINQLIDEIKNNFHILPFSIKYICKIISILITKKFNKINEYERNAFLARFFFGKLLLPILKNPGIEVCINEFLISENTINNLVIISEILNKLLSGRFYKNNEDTIDFIPFNWFFSEKIGDIFDIFEKLL